MVSVTISVPEETRNAMKLLQEVNWSALIRKSIKEEIEKRKLKEKLLMKLNEEKEFIEWSVNLGKKAKKGRLNKLYQNDNR